ncbi:hypothetical protein [uncultured Dialister sp.]|uniref:hypothetical protein n=1 Tax=uncultured Dialister sp. TaxID=278064 RepID=UPI00265D4766|nr:hypothetical protein [uncultured Dialister sp.]
MLKTMIDTVLAIDFTVISIVGVVFMIHSLLDDARRSKREKESDNQLNNRS